MRPSPKTSILAPTRCGVDPVVETIVTSAASSPRSSASATAENTSWFIGYRDYRADAAVHAAGFSVLSSCLRSVLGSSVLGSRCSVHRFAVQGSPECAAGPGNSERPNPEPGGQSLFHRSAMQVTLADRLGPDAERLAERPGARRGRELAAQRVDIREADPVRHLELDARPPRQRPAHELRPDGQRRLRAG